MAELVSIIIPTFNSERTVIKTIEACLAQDYPKEGLEIIVVDDGSADNTREKTKGYPIIYIYQPNSGPAAARNRGWKAARGRIICFTDSDCLPEIPWVSKIVKNFKDISVAAVGGSYGIANEESLLADCIYREIIARHSKMSRFVKALGSFNLSVRRELLEKTGGFNEKYKLASGEDNDLSYRILKEGGRLLFDKEIKVAHYHPEKLYKYLRTQFWHGYWRVKLYIDHPAMTGGDDYSGVSDYIQPCLAVLILCMIPFCPFFVLARKAALWAILLEAVLQIPVFLTVFKDTRKLKYAFLIPVTFLRAFYRGLGMCMGAIRFILKEYKTSVGADPRVRPKDNKGPTHGSAPTFLKIAFIIVITGFGLCGAPVIGNADDKNTQQKQFDASNPQDIKEVIKYLNGLRESKPEDPKIREELAKAYDYYAIQLSSRDMATAMEYMQRASDLEPENTEYSRNLGILHLKAGYAYYSAKQADKAAAELKSAVTADPNNIDALVLLGELNYSDNKLEDALNYWQKALAVSPGNASIIEKIERVRKDMASQGGFKKRETQNFIFTFDEGLNEFKFGNMETILNEVYVKLGQDFNYFPTYRVVVQVYPLEKYRKEVDPSDNVIGIYDGKIKLPEYSRMKESDYRRIVYHEYMHALVYDISGNKAPHWLQEGLATYADPDFKADTGFLSYLYKNNRLVPPVELEAYFTNINNAENISIAYNEANSLISYFFSRYNFWNMKNILIDLKGGMDIDEAFRKEISAGSGEFFTQWEETNFKK